VRLGPARPFVPRRTEPSFGSARPRRLGQTKLSGDHRPVAQEGTTHHHTDRRGCGCFRRSAGSDSARTLPAKAAAVVGPRAGGEGGEGIDDAPSLLADAIEFPRRTKIRQGLFRVFANNVPGNPLAALGCLSPLVAGAALSSASVVGRRFRSAAGAHSKWYHLSIGL
jgi:hypothetical protein